MKNNMRKDIMQENIEGLEKLTRVTFIYGIMAIVFIITLLLIGCSKEEPQQVQQCDYTPFITQQNTLIASNTDCNTKLSTANTEIGTLKSQVLGLLNNNSQSTACVQESCTTVVRLLNKKESDLEECWLNSNTTVVYENVTYDNSTLRALYDACINTLEDINESLGI